MTNVYAECHLILPAEKADWEYSWSNPDDVTPFLLEPLLYNLTEL